MSGLPDTWLRVALGDVVDYGKSAKADPEEIAADAWVLDLEDIEKDSSRLLHRTRAAETSPKSTKNVFKAGDVLYGKLRPYLNKVLIADEPGYCTTEILPLDAQGLLHQQYLFYWLKSTEFLDYVVAQSHGMNMPRLGTDAGRAAPLVVAPLAEQQRIADKLEAVLGRVDACRDRLARVGPLLKRFRQSVLQAGTAGTLTDAWRQRNGEAPWRDATLGELGIVSGGLTKNARREALVTRYRYLRVANVYANRLALDDVADIGATEAEIRKTRLEDGDLLIVEGNGSIEQVGRVAMWRGALLDCSHQNHLIRWRAGTDALPAYVLYWLMSPQGRAALMARASSSSGLHTLSISKVGSIALSIPSIAEQAAIVAEVQRLFELADRLEARLLTALRWSAHLTPALLAKAFRGELVPQDPTDEPAQALLDRLRAARASEPPGRRRRQPAGA